MNMNEGVLEVEIINPHHHDIFLFIYKHKKIPKH